MPNQHYYNTQKLVHSKYVSMATAISINQDLFFWYQDADDRLEGFFGMDRDLRGGANFDQIQFEERSSDVMALAEIFARRPHLYRGARRLGGTAFDHTNPVSILAKGNAPAALSGVTLSTAWTAGAAAAAMKLTVSCGAHDPSLFSRADVDWWIISQHATHPDLVRPFGEYVGIIHVGQSHRAFHKGAALVADAVEPIVSDSKPRVAGFGVADFWTMYPRGAHGAG